jgi:hypothetical protein
VCLCLHAKLSSNSSLKQQHSSSSTNEPLNPTSPKSNGARIDDDVAAYITNGLNPAYAAIVPYTIPTSNGSRGSCADENDFHDSQIGPTSTPHTGQFPNPMETDYTPTGPVDLDHAQPTNGNSGAYADDLGLNNYSVNQFHQLSTPMETDTFPFLDGRTGSVDVEHAEPTINVDAQGYVNDSDRNNSNVNPTSSPGQSLAPMETDASPHFGTHEKSNHQTSPVDGPTQVSTQATGVNVDANASSQPSSGSNDVPPAWVIRLGQQFLDAFHAQQAQDRVCFSSEYLAESFIYLQEVLTNMQTGLKEATEKMTTVTERLDLAEKAMETQRTVRQRNPQIPNSKRRTTRDAYDGDTEEIPSGGKGPKTQLVNQFHVSGHTCASLPRCRPI